MSEETDDNSKCIKIMEHIRDKFVDMDDQRISIYEQKEGEKDEEFIGRRLKALEPLRDAFREFFNGMDMLRTFLSNQDNIAFRIQVQRMVGVDLNLPYVVPDLYGKLDAAIQRMFAGQSRLDIQKSQDAEEVKCALVEISVKITEQDREIARLKQKEDDITVRQVVLNLEKKIVRENMPGFITVPGRFSSKRRRFFAREGTFKTAIPAFMKRKKIPFWNDPDLFVYKEMEDDEMGRFQTNLEMAFPEFPKMKDAERLDLLADLFYLTDLKQAGTGAAHYIDETKAEHALQHGFQPHEVPEFVDRDGFKSESLETKAKEIVEENEKRAVNRVRFQFALEISRKLKIL